MTTDTIQHEALVTLVGKDRTIIELVQAEACQTCSAKGACGVSESDKKTFEIQKSDFSVGEKVNVEITSNTALRALFTAYLFPFLIVFMTLLGLIVGGVNEGLAGLVSLVTLPVYYLFISKVLAKTSQPFHLTIKKL